jgi:cytochrome c oxidase subunit 1
VGRLDPLHDADALRCGVPANVRHWRINGIPLAFNATDLYLHDTYYVIGHFHYIVAPGTIFAIFAGVLLLVPKATGRQMSDWLGKLHFWGSLITINGVFFPMLLQGMAGVHRRWYDGGVTYDQLAGPVLHWNSFMSTSAFLLALAQIPFIINFFWSIKNGRKVGRNPWDATTLEWDAPPAAARQLRQGHLCPPRAVRVQRSRCG